MNNKPNKETKLPNVKKMDKERYYVVDVIMKKFSGHNHIEYMKSSRRVNTYSPQVYHKIMLENRLDNMYGDLAIDSFVFFLSFKSNSELPQFNGYVDLYLSYLEQKIKVNEIEKSFQDSSYFLELFERLKSEFYPIFVKLLKTTVDIDFPSSITVELVNLEIYDLMKYRILILDPVHFKKHLKQIQ